MVKYTDRVQRIWRILANKSDREMAITPLHLLLAMCEENTGPCAELHQYLMKKYGHQFLLDYEKHVIRTHSASLLQTTLPFPVTGKMMEVLNMAEKRMIRYNQTLLNEGHLMQATLRIDSSLGELFTEQDLIMFDKILCRARDMLVPLDNYFPSIENKQLFIRRALKKDEPEIIDFVKSEFGSGWLESIKNGMEHEDISIFVAYHNNIINGFACYEAHDKKRGTFGPMGISNQNREHGVGTILLHHCLLELKRKKYKYAILEGAGPIEFYEKVVGAMLIPIKENDLNK
ncbi:GNAT family N-acetyltransferase [Sutcliffiella rhizosphaerae]|uniref:N-acetyltransferase domain-containing protein n=1 Tax=Sutcliffiella rhizosphaerae TaxID=2880967 RepID=A0ABM8YJ94_9BACI|nr:GNAT family N-acetyltransferase [Sutcliffiella rhizosphaerae]CAG9619932.1 hypothetical protein BACCIP111883_00700 [Sutcliffiella rhizosphaerae]